MTEADIKKEIRDWLSEQGIFCYPAITTGIPDANVQGGFRKAPVAGLSDIAGVLPDGRALYIEVKKPKSHTKPQRLIDQTKFLMRVNYNHGVGFFAHSLQEAQEKLQPELDKIPELQIHRSKEWAQEILKQMKELGL